MMVGKRSISWLMAIVAIAAVCLAVFRGPERSSWLMRNAIFLLLGSSILGLVWFISVPKYSFRLARGNRDRQRRILQCVLGTPLGGDLKLFARFMLGLNYQATKRYDLAESAFRTVLRQSGRGLDPGFEAQVRLRLADALEILGRSEEAVEERGRTEATARGADNFASLDVRGRLLDRQHRYAEAYAAYERAMALAPPNQKAVYVALMMRLTHSSFNAGRPADSLRWAVATIELDPTGPKNCLARQMAAAASANLGRLGDAERFARDAIDRAATPGERAAALGLSADYMMRRGNLDGAEEAACESESINPGKATRPWIVIANIAAQRGQFAETISAYERALAINEGLPPAGVHRLTATIQRDLAVLHAELGRCEAAKNLLAKARALLAGDVKLTASLEVSCALVAALCNDRDSARDHITAAEEGWHKVPGDPATQRAVLYHLTRVWLLIGEPDQAESSIRAYLALDPDPVFRPYAYYHLAECRLKLGDIDGGREFDARAASTSYGTRWERLARERLAQDVR